MTKRTDDMLREFCDAIVIDASYTAAARRIAIAPGTAMRWIAQSQKNPEDWTFEWQETSAPLFDHVRAALRQNIHIIQARVLSMCTQDTEEVIVFGGKISYVEDELKVGLTLDECTLIDGHADYYLRDKSGNRIPLTIKRKVSDALILRTLEAGLPKTWSKQVDLNVSAEHRHVLVVGGKHEKAETPKVIEHVVEQAPVEDRLAGIRERMKAEADAFLANPDRITSPTGNVEKFGPMDGDVLDKPPKPHFPDGEMVRKVNPDLIRPPAPPVKPAHPTTPSYARAPAPAAGEGIQGTGAGPDPRVLRDGSRGVRVS